MAKPRTECTSKKKSKPRPELGGKKAKFVCKRCDMLARNKGEICKPRKI